MLSDLGILTKFFLLMVSYQKELDAAITAVRLAAQITTAVRQQIVSGHSLNKADRSPVTIADYGAQALVFDALAQVLPDIPAVGEEDAGVLAEPEHTDLLQSLMHFIHEVNPELNQDQILAAINRGDHPGGAEGRFWSLDPIDGTKGFLRDDQHAIALALIEDGRPVLGVLGCPSLPMKGTTQNIGCLFAAAEGVPPFTQSLFSSESPQPIHVSETSDTTKAIFCESVESSHSSHSASAAISEALATTAFPVRMDSQCKYAVVARGEADLYLRLPTRSGYQEKIWDHAAGAYLVQAAGGTVTDIEGKPLNFSLGRTLRANQGVVASNGKFHEQVLKAIRKTGAI